MIIDSEFHINKKNLLRPRALQSIDRLRRMVEMDNAPATIMGMFAWSTLKVVLATYGNAAGLAMADDLIKHELHDRFLCSWKDCLNQRTESGVCESCEKELGIDSVSLQVMDLEAEQIVDDAIKPSFHDESFCAIYYEENGVRLTLNVGAEPRVDNARTLEEHLKTHRPDAKFLGFRLGDPSLWGE